MKTIEYLVIIQGEDEQQAFENYLAEHAIKEVLGNGIVSYVAYQFITGKIFALDIDDKEKQV